MPRFLCDACDKELPDSFVGIKSKHGIVCFCSERCKGDYRAREFRENKVQRSLALGVAAFNGN